MWFWTLLNAAEFDRSGFICIVQATLQCVTISSLLWNIFEKWCLKTNPVEWKLKPVTHIYIYEAGNKGFVFSSRWTPRPDTAAYSQTSTQTYTHTHTNTEKQKCSEKREEMEEKNLDPCGGLCVGTGEQFVLQNSHYQHSAAGLQLAGVERSVARPNEGLIFLLFLLKCRYDQLPTAKILPASSPLFQFLFSTENSPQICQ